MSSTELWTEVSRKTNKFLLRCWRLNTDLTTAWEAGVIPRNPQELVFVWMWGDLCAGQQTGGDAKLSQAAWGSHWEVCPRILCTKNRSGRIQTILMKYSSYLHQGGMEKNQIFQEIQAKWISSRSNITWGTLLHVGVLVGPLEKGSKCPFLQVPHCARRAHSAGRQQSLWRPSLKSSANPMCLSFISIGNVVGLGRFHSFFLAVVLNVSD